MPLDFGSSARRPRAFVAVLLSVLVPGAGHICPGSSILAPLFLGAWLALTMQLPGEDGRAPAVVVWLRGRGSPERR